LIGGVKELRRQKWNKKKEGEDKSVNRKVVPRRKKRDGTERGEGGMKQP